MLVLGINGSLKTRQEAEFTGAGMDYFAHNASAALVRDGEVIAAIEEERLSRAKHTHKFPVSAVRECLRLGGVTLEDVDRVAFYLMEAYLDHSLQEELLEQTARNRPAPVGITGREALQRLLAREFGVTVPPERLTFVRHHFAHAVSAYAQSGFDDALVLSLDAGGDIESGLVATARRHEIDLLHSWNSSLSLGIYYLSFIRYLGYSQFDEYKVMGLAPYGDPARFRSRLQQSYQLLPGGDYRVAPPAVIGQLFRGIVAPRRRDEPFTQTHRDLAAALQSALEEIVLHVLRHYRAVGPAKLCLAGGVALNCTMNGRVLAAGLFDDVFVQPAAYDAGCSIGAALSPSFDFADRPRRRRSARKARSGGGALRHVFWGSPIGDERTVRRALEPWRDLVTFARQKDAARTAAQLLADGQVIGWVQGRAEFGPRALGNRSILADPRPAANKDRINAMVKKREGYRPFAPSVLLDEMRTWFEVPPNVAELPFMLFVVPVRPAHRQLLGAITHVDGTARIQTVAREVHPRYWELIRAFQELTGVPIVLNTSFNNNAEPIVDSVEDALVCYLTTGLDALVVGDYLVTRQPAADGSLERCFVSLPWYAVLREQIASGAGELRAEHAVHGSGFGRFHSPVDTPLAPLTYAVLARCDGTRALGAVLDSVAARGEARRAVLTAMRDLWARRAVRIVPRPLRPGATAGRRRAAGRRA
jgi:carbamoyltransferase